jgi:hypothetical protein
LTSALTAGGGWPSMLFLGSPGSRLRARLQMSCKPRGASFAAGARVLACLRADRGPTPVVTRLSLAALAIGFASSAAGPIGPRLGPVGDSGRRRAPERLAFAAGRSASRKQADKMSNEALSSSERDMIQRA